MTWNDLMNIKNESAKEGLKLNGKTKVMTAEELQNFNVDNEDVRNVKFFLYPDSIISPDRNGRQEIRRLTWKSNYEGTTK